MKKGVAYVKEGAKQNQATKVQSESGSPTIGGEDRD